MCTAEPKPVFGGISEDFLEEGGWDLMVGITHDSFRDVQLAQATQSTVSKEGLGTVVFLMCPAKESSSSLKGVGS